MSLGIPALSMAIFSYILQVKLGHCSSAIAILKPQPNSALMCCFMYFERLNIDHFGLSCRLYNVLLFIKHFFSSYVCLTICNCSASFAGPVRLFVVTVYLFISNYKTMMNFFVKI